MNPAAYARLALEAYSAMPDIGVEESSARAILRVTEDGLCFAFPGTNNIACWLADLDVETRPVKGLGALHCGFWDSLLLIIANLWQHERSLGMDDGLPVVLCGHSEGAALALLFAAYLTLNGRPPAAVFAFEPPRISADDTLAKLLANVPCHLYQHGNDIVPMVPRVLHDWQHPAPLVHIGKACQPFPNIEDHEMARVLAALEET